MNNKMLALLHVIAGQNDQIEKESAGLKILLLLIQNKMWKPLESLPSLSSGLSTRLQGHPPSEFKESPFKVVALISRMMAFKSFTLSINIMCTYHKFYIPLYQ